MRFAIIIAIVVSILLIVGISNAQQDSQQLSEKPKEIIGKDGAKMVLIPAGEFQMGTDSSEIPDLVKVVKQFHPKCDAKTFKPEMPRHTVYLDAFYMDAYEVTNAQYRKFIQATGHKEPVEDYKSWDDKTPVVCVSWEDAKAYAEWAGKRLPTEAEWEYAARGGLVGKRYVWGDEYLPPNGTENLADKALADEGHKKGHNNMEVINSYDDGYSFLAPAGSLKPNGYGLYDMGGNVMEWCADWYSDKYYAKSPKSNPQGAESGKYHVLRGGCWIMNEPCRISYRQGYNPPNQGGFLRGFRCVSSIITQ